MKSFAKLIVITAFLASCSFEKQSKNSLLSIDIVKKYPEKDILLTDIANITYLCLNSDDDDYLYKGSISYITKNTIVVVDGSSGSILFSPRMEPRNRVLTTWDKVPENIAERPLCYMMKLQMNYLPAICPASFKSILLPASINGQLHCLRE